jgi:hypothetical protein
MKILLYREGSKSMNNNKCSFLDFQGLRFINGALKRDQERERETKWHAWNCETNLISSDIINH